MKKRVIISILLLYLSVILSAEVFASEIHEAAARGDLKKVREILKRRPELVNLRELNDGNIRLLRANSKYYIWERGKTYSEFMNNRKEFELYGDWTAYSPLYRAVENGHYETAKFLISKGADVNAKEGTTVTIVRGGSHHFKDPLEELIDSCPLAAAVRNSDSRMIELLILSGADLNEKQSGSNPLKNAIENDDVSIIRKLVLSGAEYNGKYNPCWADIPPLYLAAMLKHSDSLKFLLEYDNGKNITKENRNQLLEVAIENKWPEGVKLLIQSGADPNLPNKIGQPPLHLAAYKGNPEIIKLLIGYGAKIEKKSKWGSSPLQRAVIEGSFENVMTLIDMGADVNVEICGISLLHIAAREGRIDVTKVLLEKGLYPDVGDGKGYTSLDYAIINSHLSMIEFLVDYMKKDTGYEPSLLESFKLALEIGKYREVKLILELLLDRSNKERLVYSLLHLAVRYNDTQTVDYLLMRLVETDVINNLGQTPLHYCAMYGSTETFHKLVKKGANIKEVDNEGNTLLHLAVKEKNLPMVKFLLLKTDFINTHNKEGLTPLHIAVVRYNGEESANILIKSGADVDASDNNGNTPLHCAAINNCFDSIVELLKNKAEVNSRNHRGETPLLVSLRSRSNCSTEKLIEWGADVHAVDNDGKTILFQAAEAGDPAIVQTLVDMGVKINKKEKSGLSAFYYAVKSGNIETILYMAVRLESSISYDFAYSLLYDSKSAFIIIKTLPNIYLTTAGSLIFITIFLFFLSSFKQNLTRKFVTKLNY